MEELIKRLERVIQTGAPDKNGMHPISAETMLEVVKGLSGHGTNLASLGTDCSEFPNNSVTISRQAAIEALLEAYPDNMDVEFILGKLPPAQPKRGKWIDAVIPNDNGGLLVQVCDQCNTFFPLAYTGGGHHFCPNCGAKMEVTT